MKGLRFNADGGLLWDGLPSTPNPLTFGLWVAPAEVPVLAQQGYMALCNPTSNVNTDVVHIGQGTDGRQLLKVQNLAGAGETRGIGGDYVVGEWRFVAVTWTDTSMMQMHTQTIIPTPGVSNLTSGTNMAGCAWTRVTVGARLTGASGTPVYSNAQIAEPFVYKRVLTRAEIELLIAGVSPEDVWSKDLVFYVPNLANYTGNSPSNWYGGEAATLRGVAPVMGTLEVPKVNFPEFA